MNGVWIRGAGGAERPRAWLSHAGVGAGGGRPSRRGDPGVSPAEKFRNFTCKILNFGAHLRKIIYLLC
jgi:hypothetical protein